MKKYRGLATSEWPPGEWAALQSRILSRSRRDPTYSSNAESARLLARLKSGYGCCLAWLHGHGLLDVLLGSAERWPAPVIERMVEEMSVNGYPPSSIRQRLYCLNGVLARLTPGCDLQHLTDEINVLPRATPNVPAVVLRISTADLVAFGIELMDNNYDAGDEEGSVTYRTGLQIAHLALRPWRADAFAKIRIGIHLRRSADRWRLVAPETQSRIKRDASGDYPARLVKYLIRYNGHHRVLLCNGKDGGDLLWVIPGGKPFSKGLLHYHLTKATEARFGEAVYPHAFRKCLSTTIAIANPSAIGILPTALRHSQQVNEQWYNMAGSVSAFEQLEESIDAELREGRASGRRARRSQR